MYGISSQGIVRMCFAKFDILFPERCAGCTIIPECKAERERLELLSHPTPSSRINPDGRGMDDTTEG